VDEFRDGALARALLDEIARTVTRPWRIMEVCGGQTHTIVREGIDTLLPDGVEYIHGPGCPVCVTPLETIDRALAIARTPGTVFASFGDMLRVPGSQGSLLDAKAAGADVRIVYSPLDAVAIAERERGKRVCFFAVGFETTAPANAMAVLEARRRGLSNFSVLAAHVLVPPAIEAVLGEPDRRVDGFLAAGHVCTVMGTSEYVPLAARWRVPIVVTGFEPLDILEGTLMVLRQLEEGRAEVENQYARSVREGGAPAARRAVEAVFEVAPRKWRGMGEIPRSGLRLRGPYADMDADRVFGTGAIEVEEPPECRQAEVLTGRIKPFECAEFGTRCTPERPLGAAMVSAEGACSAYFRYGRGPSGAALPMARRQSPAAAAGGAP
jgi:hydrogenase expression/formation protein HypD